METFVMSNVFVLMMVLSMPPPSPIVIVSIPIFKKDDLLAGPSTKFNADVEL